ncbi:uncharacterized protein LOC119998615 [Tripterygium wilfordii]|uniref:uncharacterized protein LOC119998615 n=1 Tax=Tripterygium wilfordii TaxID=458696 RepID=UPI0018F8615D|nr:uncharacterized protein LOC119998615 [Tripterygium wilfordii]
MCIFGVELLTPCKNNVNQYQNSLFCLLHHEKAWDAVEDGRTHIHLYEVTDTWVINLVDNGEYFDFDFDTEFVEPEVNHDTTLVFTTDLIFDSKEMVIELTRRTRHSNGVMDYFGCERSGTYKWKKDNGKGKRVVKRRKSSSKKCNSRFRLQAQMVDTTTKKWALHVQNDHNNHELMKLAEGHNFVGRLTEEEKVIVERLGKTEVRTREIFHQIKLNDTINASAMRTICNVRSTSKIKEMAGRTHMQQLFKLLIELGYVTKYRSKPTTNVVQDLLWAYSPSIQVVKAFLYVYMLHCTYKTNKYRLSLLEIVGVTSTNKT